MAIGVLIKRGKALGEVVELPRTVREIAHELERYLESAGPAKDDHTGPTPERIKRMAEEGTVLRASVAVGEDDTVTTWRISPKLNDMLSRKTITQLEFQAAQRFLRDYFLGMYAGPASSRYAERTGPSHNETDRDTRRLHHAMEWKRAAASIDRVYQPVLAWLVKSLGEGAPLAVLGSYYAPGLGSQTQAARGGQVLSLCCMMLCRHYGMDHPLDLDKRITGLSHKLLETKQG